MAELFLKAVQVWNDLLTVDAAGCPEIEENDLATQLLKGERACDVEPCVAARKLWRLWQRIRDRDEAILVRFLAGFLNQWCLKLWGRITARDSNQGDGREHQEPDPRSHASRVPEAGYDSLTRVESGRNANTGEEAGIRRDVVTS